MRIGVWLVGLFHLTIVVWAASEGGDLLSQPIRNDDSAIHFYSAVRSVEHLLSAGAFWGYDPSWMAGYPEGSLGMVDNKLFSALVFLVPEAWQAAAYNAGYLSAVLAPPWLLYWAARTAGSSRAAATGAALAASIASLSIPLVVSFLLWGGVSFFLSSVLSVPATLLLARAIAAGGLVTARGGGALVLASATLFVHPAILPVIAAGIFPAVVFAAVAGRRRGALVDVCLVGVAILLPYLPVVDGYLALRDSLRADPGAAFLHGGLSQLREDWWTHLVEIDWLPHGAGGLPGLCLLAALSAFLAYGASSLVPRLVSLQPYRFVLPMAFLLCLPAGVALAEVVRGRGAARLLALAAFAIMLEAGFAIAPIVAFGTGFDPAEDALVELVKRDGAGGGRTLVESHFQAFPASRDAAREIKFKRFALLPLKASGEYLGYTAAGLVTRQQYTRFGEGKLFGRKLKTLDEQELAGLLARYAVGRVVACTPRSMREFHRLGSVLEQRDPVGGCWSFGVRNPEPSRMLEGGGVVRGSPGRVEVRDADGERVVLKYHWMPSLATIPPLPIEEAPQPGAPIGFIAVRPGSQRDFDVVARRSRPLLRAIVEAFFQRLSAAEKSP